MVSPSGEGTRRLVIRKRIYSRCYLDTPKSIILVLIVSPSAVENTPPFLTSMSYASVRAIRVLGVPAKHSSSLSSSRRWPRLGRCPCSPCRQPRVVAPTYGRLPPPPPPPPPPAFARPPLPMLLQLLVGLVSRPPFRPIQPSSICLFLLRRGGEGMNKCYSFAFALAHIVTTQCCAPQYCVEDLYAILFCWLIAEHRTKRHTVP